jgi:hypothetical protein
MESHWGVDISLNLSFSLGSSHRLKHVKWKLRATNSPHNFWLLLPDEASNNLIAPDETGYRVEVMLRTFHVVFLNSLPPLITTQ